MILALISCNFELYHFLCIIYVTNNAAKSNFVLICRYEKGLEDYDEAAARMRQARGMMDDYHDHDHDHIPEHPVMKEEMKEEKKATATDPWASYYDFIINEGSFKFWSVFQVGTDL